MRSFLQASLICVLATGCVRGNSSPSSTGQTSGNKVVPPGRPDAAKDSTAQERAKLVGIWTATGGEFQGIRMDAAALKDMKWAFTNDNVSFSMLGKAMEAT